MIFAPMGISAVNAYCNWMEKVAACEKQSAKSSWIGDLQRLFR